MCRQDEGRDGTEGRCGCFPGSDGEKGSEEKEEMARLRERKCRLEREMARVDRRMKDLDD